MPAPTRHHVEQRALVGLPKLVVQLLGPLVHAHEHGGVGQRRRAPQARLLDVAAGRQGRAGLGGVRGPQRGVRHAPPLPPQAPHPADRCLARARDSPSPAPRPPTMRMRSSSTCSSCAPSTFWWSVGAKAAGSSVSARGAVGRGARRHQALGRGGGAEAAGSGVSETAEGREQQAARRPASRAPAYAHSGVASPRDTTKPMASGIASSRPAGWVVGAAQAAARR